MGVGNYVENRQWSLLRSNDIDFQHIFGKLTLSDGTYKVKVNNSGKGNYNITPTNDISGVIKFGGNGSTEVYTKYGNPIVQREAVQASNAIMHMKGVYMYELLVHDGILYLFLNQKSYDKRKLVFYCTGEIFD